MPSRPGALGPPGPQRLQQPVGVAPRRGPRRRRVGRSPGPPSAVTRPTVGAGRARPGAAGSGGAAGRTSADSSATNGEASSRGHDRDGADGAGDGDVEHAALLLDVVGQAVGEQAASASCTTTCGHSRPFTRCTVASARRPGRRACASCLAQPRLERAPASGCRRGQRHQGVEVVALRRPGSPTAAMPSSGVDAPRRGPIWSRTAVSSRAGARPPRPGWQRLEVVGEGRHLVGVAVAGAGRPGARRPSRSRCSPIHSTTRGDRPRPGGAAPSPTSAAGRAPGGVARRSQASAARTPVRSSEPAPTRRADRDAPPRAAPPAPGRAAR